MNDSKHPLKSLGIVGPLLALVVLAANHAKPGLGLGADDLSPAIDAVDALVGCMLGIVGRWRATKQISLSLVALLVALPLALGACSSQQIAQGESDANAAVTAAQPTIALACWLAQAADAGFQAYALSQSAAAAVIADEQKAMAAATTICAAPPADLAQAVGDVLAAYKSIVAVTPAVKTTGA